MTLHSRPLAFLVVLTALSVAVACGSEEPSSIWDGVGGRILYLGGETQDSLRSVDPASGALGSVPGAPRASDISAPASGAFLVVSSRRIYKFDLATNSVSLIVDDDDGASNQSAVASPDGLRIAYQRTDVNGSSVVVREIGSASARTLYGPTKTAHAQQLGWVDDSTVVFLAQANGPHRLWSARIDGTKLGFFASDTGLVVDAVQPGPLGSGLLVVIVRPPGTILDDLWLMDDSGRLLRKIATLTGGYPFFAWSPHGEYIATCLPTPTSTADLVLFHVQSGAMRILMTDPGFRCVPVWIP